MKFIILFMSQKLPSMIFGLYLQERKGGFIMSQFKALNAAELTKNTFNMIGKQWMLITAKNGDTVNTMTAAWGGLGIMWGKNVAFLVIRPQRYTKEFIDASTSLSLSFLDDSYKKTLSYLGSVSGRDEDKITNSGLTIAEQDSIPYFEESEYVFLCKKLFAQDWDKDAFLEKEILEKWYPDEDYHTLYVVEIEKILQK